GETPWPRLFHNLRASCATDWSDRFPAHAVAKWLGHSPLIAATHYLQTRDAHFDAAAGLETSAHSSAPRAQKRAQHDPASSTQVPANEPEVLCGSAVTGSEGDSEDGDGWAIQGSNL